VALITSGWAVLVLICMGSVCYSLSRVFAVSAGQLRRIEASSQTPLYQAILEISNADGLRLARAFQQQVSLKRQTALAISKSKTPLWLLEVGQRWYYLVLSFFVRAYSWDIAFLLN